MFEPNKQIKGKSKSIPANVTAGFDAPARNRHASKISREFDRIEGLDVDQSGA